MRPADFVLLNLQIMMSLALRILLPGSGLGLCLFSSTGKEPLAVNFLVGESLIPEAVQIHHSGVILGLSGGLLRGRSWSYLLPSGRTVRVWFISRKFYSDD